MRQKFFTLCVTLLLCVNSVAYAEPPLIGDYNDRLVIEFCTLKSETPHISGHVPGTVNVTARTICKGISAGRHLRLTITLLRKDGGNTPPITKSFNGVGSVIGNVALPCIWVRKQAEIEYIVTTVHRMSNGKSGTTRNGAVLKC